MRSVIGLNGLKKGVKASTYKDRVGQYMVGRMSTNG